MVFQNFYNLNINFGKSNVSQITFVQQRDMFTIKWLEKFVNSTNNTVGTKLISQPVRNYPGEFIPFKQLQGKSPQGEPLDLIHVHIMDAKTRVAFAYATSAKKDIDGKPTYRLGDDKLNGHITRLRDPETNEYLKDAKGNYIPDPVCGGQRIGIYKNPRKFEDENRIKIQEDKTAGCDFYEDAIKNIRDESGILDKEVELVKKTTSLVKFDKNTNLTIYKESKENLDVIKTIKKFSE